LDALVSVDEAGPIGIFLHKATSLSFDTSSLVTAERNLDLDTNMSASWSAQWERSDQRLPTFHRLFGDDRLSAQRCLSPGGLWATETGESCVEDTSLPVRRDRAAIAIEVRYDREARTVYGSR
jgi:hypothetical protein